MALKDPSIGITLINGNQIGLYIEQNGAAEQKLGLVQGLNWNEDYQVQPWQVLSFWGNAGYTSLGYNLSLTINLFIPHQKNVILNDGGVISVHDIEWTRDKAQAKGQPLVMDKLIVKSEGAPGANKPAEIVDVFYKAMLSSQSGNVSAGQQVMRNLTLLAVSRANPNSGLPVSKVNA